MVVTDLTMPDLNGVEATRQLRREGFTGGGRPDALGVAVEKLHAQCGFEFGNALADRRCGDVLTLGGLGDAVFFDHREEQFQGREVGTHDSFGMAHLNLLIKTNT